MHAARFDNLVKTLTRRRSRRAALAAGGGLGAALLGVARTPPAAQPATPGPTSGAAERTAFLFVQTFDGGTWAPKPGQDGIYELALTGAPGHTVYFADRPARDVGTIPTERFLAILGFGSDDPPNAALVAQTEAGEDVLVVELLAPRYDAAAGTLSYDARPLVEYRGAALAGLAMRQADQELPESFGPASLFIDAERIEALLTCQDQPGDICNEGPGNLCNVAATCYCGATPEGVGGCVVGDRNLCARRACTASHDCRSGELCVMTGSCCGAGSAVCMPLCQD